RLCRFPTRRRHRASLDACLSPSLFLLLYYTRTRCRCRHQVKTCRRQVKTCRDLVEARHEPSPLRATIPIRASLRRATDVTVVPVGRLYQPRLSFLKMSTRITPNHANQTPSSITPVAPPQ